MVVSKWSGKQDKRLLKMKKARKKKSLSILNSKQKNTLKNLNTFNKLKFSKLRIKIMLLKKLSQKLRSMKKHYHNKKLLSNQFKRKK